VHFWGKTFLKITSLMWFGTKYKQPLTDAAHKEKTKSLRGLFISDLNFILFLICFSTKTKGICNKMGKSL
jgi:hypothetical protein